MRLASGWRLGMRGRRAVGRRCPWRRAGRFRRYWAATMSATGCARPGRASWRATRRRGSWSASLPTGCGFGTATADGHLADTRTAQGGLCRRRLLFPRPREDASPAEGRASLRCCERDEQATRAGRGARRASLRSGRARRATLAPLRRGVPVHARRDPAPRWRRSVVGGAAHVDNLCRAALGRHYSARESLRSWRTPGGTAVDGRRPERCLRARLYRAAPDGIKARA